MPDTLQTIGRVRPDHSWRESAACLGLDADLFIPAGVGAHVDPLVWATCRACPVIQACLDDAIRTGEINTGVRGGTSPSERRRMKVGDEPKILKRRCKDCGGPAPSPGARFCGACAEERADARDVAGRRRNQRSVA